MFCGLGDVLSALNNALSELRVTDACIVKANTSALGMQPYSTRCQLLQSTFDLFSAWTMATYDGSHRLNCLDDSLGTRLHLIVSFVLNIAEHFLDASSDDVSPPDHFVRK